jgi:hypothetical protein
LGFDGERRCGLGRGTRGIHYECASSSWK